MSALNGAKEVTITDYPSTELLRVLSRNVDKNIPPRLRHRLTVSPHLWGDTKSALPTSHREYYTRVLAADTLWLAGQHENLAKSMLHFLSRDEDARVFVIAGFHTGRGRLTHFFEETVPENGLQIESIFEMDADGRRRDWRADVGEEHIGERKKWVVVATLRRR
jgi:Lysine methyltransferase